MNKKNNEKYITFPKYFENYFLLKLYSFSVDSCHFFKCFLKLLHFATISLSRQICTFFLYSMSSLPISMLYAFRIVLFFPCSVALYFCFYSLFHLLNSKKFIVTKKHISRIRYLCHCYIYTFIDNNSKLFFYY
jgi:hypothetical protein